MIIGICTRPRLTAGAGTRRLRTAGTLDPRFTRVLAVAALSILLTAGLVGGAGLTAHAADADASASASPSLPSPDAPDGPGAGGRAVIEPPPDGMLTAPSPLAITSPAADTFIGRSSVTVAGTRDPAATVEVDVGAADSAVCVIGPDGTDRFSCLVAVTSSPHAELRARQIIDGQAFPWTTVPVRVLTPPTIIGGSTLEGTALPGATVIATTSNGASCTVGADMAGGWRCRVSPELEPGTYEAHAVQQSSYSSGETSDPSPSVTVTIVAESTGPVITSPTSGQTVAAESVAFSGTGREEANISVFANGRLLCSAKVTGGVWSCTAPAVPSGAVTVSALQSEGAGVPLASKAVTLTVTPAPQSPAATPTGSTATPSPSASELAEAEQVMPQVAGDGTTDADSRGAVLQADGWAAATSFTSALSSRAPATAGADWVKAAGISLAALLLVAVPARLLAATVASRRDHRWAGTDRSALRQRHGPAMPGATRARTPAVWATRGAGVLAAAALVMMSGPVGSHPAYVRLFIAVVIAVVAVNAVMVLLPRLVPGASVTFSPMLLLMVAAAALGSRLVGLHPALIFGLVLMSSLAPDAPAKDRARLAMVQTLGLAALGAVTWVALGWLPAPTDFMDTLLVETLTVTALTALGSAAISLVPAGIGAGAAILAWSPVTWTVTTLVLGTMVFMTLTPALGLGSTGPTPVIVTIVATVFAGVSLTVWAWRRYVTLAEL